MSKNQNTINEMKRAAATAMLTVGIAGAFFGMVHLFDAPPRAAEAEVTASEFNVPHRPAGGRRFRSSNAEQSQTVLAYYGEPDQWGRNRATLEGAMTLFQMGGTFSSTELTGGTLRVTLTKDYLA